MTGRSPVGRWRRRLFHAPTRLYDWNLGWLLGRRFACITHRGRRSGRSYRTVVEVVARDDPTGEIVVASGFGPDADWYRNLRAHPALEIRTGRHRFAPEQRLLTADEAAAVLADYRRRHPLAARAIGRLLDRLNGVEVNWSPSALRQLGERMPMVGFRPPPSDAEGAVYQ